MLEVFDFVDVEGRLDPPDRQPGVFGPSADAVELCAGAHRNATEDIVKATHPDQVVATVVGRSEGEIVSIKLAKGECYDLDGEMRRVGGDQDNPLLAAGCGLAEELLLALGPVSFFLE